jgi:N-acetylmuramoyl-L-alanine amidase
MAISKGRLASIVGVTLCLTVAGLLVGGSLRNTITPIGIIIHHSAIPRRPDGGSIDARLIDEIHQRRGYRTFYWGRVYHVGYHYIILPDGTVQQGRPEHCKGAHASGYNSYIGICLVGDFSSGDNPNGERGLMAPTEAQMTALIDLCKRLSVDYQIPAEHILRHSDVKQNTDCPGDRFPYQRLLEAFKKR